MTTLEDVLIDLTMNGADRCALVRHGAPGELVLLTSGAAVQRIGPGLVSILREMGDSGKREIARVGCNTPIKEIFILTDDAASNGWAWFEMPFGRLNDPAKAAPGYEIVERR